MKLIMDLVMNHTSSKHVWFQKSIEQLDPYTDYYIWKDPSGYDDEGRPLPPNNWRSIFNGRSWEYNAKRNQFYYHAFSSEQPDLNFRNKEVILEMKRIINFWIKRGVDGFRIDAVPFLMEDDYLKDEETDSREHTMNHPGTFRLLNKFRTFLDRKYNVNASPDNEIIFIAEAVQQFSVAVKYYGKKNFPIVHFPFNFDFLIMPPNPDEGYPVVLTPKYFDYHIKNWLENIPTGEVVNWVSESHDIPRISDRIDPSFRDIFVTLTMMLPGTVSIYYGQEIGMVGMKIPEHRKMDRFHGRDSCRTAMQWSGRIENAGFSTNHRTWLPINPNFRTLNVETQKRQKYSHYQLFKALAALRQTDTIKIGEFKSYIPAQDIYLFTRRLKDQDMYIVVINLGEEVVVFDLIATLDFRPRNIKVAIASSNLEADPGVKMPEGNKLVRMPPLSTVVLVAKEPFPVPENNSEESL